MKLALGFSYLLYLVLHYQQGKTIAKLTSARKSASLSAEIFKPDTALKSSRSLRASFTPPFWKN